MVKECMFAHLHARFCDGLFLEMFVEFFDNVVVTKHKILWVVLTMMQIDKAVDVEAFLAFHKMDCTGLTAVA